MKLNRMPKSIWIRLAEIDPGSERIPDIPREELIMRAHRLAAFVRHARTLPPYQRTELMQNLIELDDLHSERD